MILIYVITCFWIFYNCWAEDQTVLQLTDVDFSSKLASLGTVLVMFSAHWCKYCTELKPEYAKAAQHLQKYDVPIYLAEVDCTTTGKETCNAHRLDGFPTLKIFMTNSKVPQEYNGPRDASGIVKYMIAKLGPSSTEIFTNDQFESFVNETDVSLIGFFERDSSLKNIFFKLADEFNEKIRFGHTIFKDVLDRQGFQDNIVLFRSALLNNKFEKNFVNFEGNTADELNDFISKNKYGIVGVRTLNNLYEFENPLIIGYYDVDYVKNIKGTNYWRNRILKVAASYLNKFSFAISSKTEFERELNKFGIDFVGNDKPIIIAKDIENRKYILNDEFSETNFQKFIEDILKGKLEPFLKSGPIPESNNKPVKIAVAKNFEDIVLNNGKDTMILFYSPSCNYCKKLFPVYDKLAKYVKNENISIVKMDATVNDMPSNYSLYGFPTIYWAPKTSKTNPIKYEGRKQIEDFLKFIANHASSELKKIDRQGRFKQKTEL